MGRPQTHAEKTSADKQAIGFEYQYWFFLFHVLQLRTGESVGLEVIDDVHTQLDNDYQILFQLKHTLQQRADGSPENLTKRDKDLWKTLWNWSKVITDEAAGRSSKQDQLEFLAKTEFVLVSNKSKSAASDLTDLLSNPQSAADSIKVWLDGTTCSKTRKHMKGVVSLDSDVLISFITRTELDLEVDGLIERCKTAILEKQIAPHRVPQLLRDVDSQIRQDNFLAVKAGEKAEITFAGFNKKYRCYFDHARSSRLQLRDDYGPLPESIESQAFIKQLLDIRDFAADDLDEMTRLTTYKQRTEKNLLRWQIEGEITGLEVRAFDEDSKARWENVFRELHKSTSDTPTGRAQAIVNRLRALELLVREQHMDIRFSNGQFYKLADQLDIGFLPEWETRYSEASATA